MASLADVMQFMSNLPAIASMAERLFFITICLFLGNFSWRGWKRYSNWGLSTIVTLILGFVILAGSILLGQLIPLRMPYIPYALNALIISVLLFIILKLLSGNVEAEGKFVKYSVFKKLRDDFNELKDKFNRLTKMLELKKITPQPLKAKDLERSLGLILADRGFKEFRINSRQISDDVKVFHINVKSNNYEVMLDVYTGELIGFKRLNLNSGERLIKSISKLFSNERVVAGSLIALTLTVILLSLINPESINEVQSSLDLDFNPLTGNNSNPFTDYTIQNDSCLSVTDSFYVINKELFSDYHDKAIIPLSVVQQINDSYTENLITDASNMTYRGVNYLIITTTSITNDEFNQDLQSYLSQNLFSVAQGSIDFCSIKHNGRSISNFYRICTAREGVLCDCKLLRHIDDYCFILSDKLSSELRSQLSGLGSQLTGLLNQVS